jgi:hypothetical protein
MSTRRTRRMRASKATLALSLAALAIATSQANASSIVYIKDANVWSANPDGSAQTQVTSDGTATKPYLSVSQSDSGTMVADLKGTLVVLRPNGSVVRTIATIGGGNPAISPDGATLAYEEIRPVCASGPSSISCIATVVLPIGSTERALAVGGFRFPSWLGNNRILLDSGSVWTYEIGAAPEAVQDWFSVPASPDFTTHGDADASPAGDRFAAVANTNRILLFSGNGAFPADPTFQCQINPAAGAVFSRPSWSPDGVSVVWAQGDGIWKADIGGALTSGCAGVTPTRIIPGAGAPDWGPANVTPVAQPGPGTPGTPATLTVGLTSPRTMKLAALRTRGVKITTTFSVDARGVFFLAVSKAEAKRLGIGRTETVIGQAGPVAMKAETRSVTIRLKARYARALKNATRISAVVASSGVVGGGEPVIRARKITFTG